MTAARRPPCRLAIFDFDGTLADSFPWFAGVLEETARRYGFRHVDAAEREALRSLAPREVIRRLGVPMWKLPLIARHIRRLKLAEAHRLKLFPGAETMLRRLAAEGIVLAIVSSDSEASIRRTLGPEAAALVRHFACGGALFGKRRKLRAVLRRSGIPASAALCIGDEVRDAEAARAAGIAFAAVAWGYATPAAMEAERPVALFRSMEEMTDWISGVAGHAGPPLR